MDYFPVYVPEPKPAEYSNYEADGSNVRAVETDPGTVGVRFRPLPRGLLEAVEQVGDHVIEPGLERVRAAVERSAGQGPLGQVIRQLGVSAGTNGR